MGSFLTFLFHTVEFSDIHLVLIVTSISILSFIILFFILKHKYKIVIFSFHTILMLFSVYLGIMYFSTHHLRQMSHSAGRNIADTLVNGTVVAEAPAFRFFAYEYHDRVSFVSESDPNYPRGIFRLILKNEPNYLVLAKSHFNFSDLMAIYFQNYKIIKTIHYQMPEYPFTTADGILTPSMSHHYLTIYKRFDQ